MMNARKSIAPGKSVRARSGTAQRSSVDEVLNRCNAPGAAEGARRQVDRLAETKMLAIGWLRHDCAWDWPSLKIARMTRVMLKHWPRAFGGRACSLDRNQLIAAPNVDRPVASNGGCGGHAPFADQCG